MPTPGMKTVVVGAEDTPASDDKHFIMPSPPPPPTPPTQPSVQMHDISKMAAGDMENVLSGIPSGVIAAFAMANYNALLKFWGCFQSAGAGAIPRLVPGSPLLTGLNQQRGSRHHLACGARADPTKGHHGTAICARAHLFIRDAHFADCHPYNNSFCQAAPQRWGIRSARPRSQLWAWRHRYNCSKWRKRQCSWRKRLLSGPHVLSSPPVSGCVRALGLTDTLTTTAHSTNSSVGEGAALETVERASQDAGADLAPLLGLENCYWWL